MNYYKSYKVNNIIKLVVFITVLFILLCFSKQNFESVKSSTSLFILNIIPSLFPFIFFSEVILNTGIIDILSKLLGSITKKIFKLNSSSTPAIIIGFLCGYPMGAKTVVTLYEQGKISKDEAVKLLAFVNNCNPIFILSTVGISIFKNMKIGIILLISHYLSALIIAFFVTHFKHSTIIQNNEIILNSNYKNTASNFFDVIKDSIKKSFMTLANIFGFIILFNLISNIFQTVLEFFNVNSLATNTVCGIFEVTKGISNISNLNIVDLFKLPLVSFMLGFSGLCIICQIYSCINSNKFSFTKLVYYKLIQGILSFIITFCIIKFSNISFNTNIQVFKSIDYNMTYTEFFNSLNLTYVTCVFIAIFLLCLFVLIHTIFFSKDKT